MAADAADARVAVSAAVADATKRFPEFGFESVGLGPALFSLRGYGFATTESKNGKMEFIAP